MQKANGVSQYTKKQSLLGTIPNLLIGRLGIGYRYLIGTSTLESVMKFSCRYTSFLQLYNFLKSRRQYIWNQYIHSSFISFVSRSERQLDNRAKRGNHHCS